MALLGVKIIVMEKNYCIIKVLTPGYYNKNCKQTENIKIVCALHVAFRYSKNIAKTSLLYTMKISYHYTFQDELSRSTRCHVVAITSPYLPICRTLSSLWSTRHRVGARSGYLQCSRPLCETRHISPSSFCTDCKTYQTL